MHDHPCSLASSQLHPALGFFLGTLMGPVRPSTTWLTEQSGPATALAWERSEGGPKSPSPGSTWFLVSYLRGPGRVLELLGALGGSSPPTNPVFPPGLHRRDPPGTASPPATILTLRFTCACRPVAAPLTRGRKRGEKLFPSLSLRAGCEASSCCV